MARTAGALLILSAVVTAVSAVSRIAADADQATTEETLDAIARNAGLYSLGGSARLVAGIALVAALPLLLRTRIIAKRHASPLVPALLGASGAVTAVSGLAAVLLAMAVPDAWSASSNPEVSQVIEATLLVRWLAGKIGFALAGLALVGASRFQWKAGGTLRRTAPWSAILGAAMQFIWVDSATFVHPIVGAAFFVWLLAIGVMLATGRTERWFPQTRNSRT